MSDMASYTAAMGPKAEEAPAGKTRISLKELSDLLHTGSCDKYDLDPDAHAAMGPSVDAVIEHLNERVGEEGDEEDKADGGDDEATETEPE